MKWMMNSSIASVLLSAVLVLGTAGCDVDKTREGQAPDVDVDVDPGRMPEYDVEGPDVDVQMKDKKVTVPDVDVDVHSEEKEVSVPDIDVTLPDEADNE